MRNYDNDLTIVLTGSGKSTKANSNALLEDFIFGTAEQVEVKLIVPFTGAVASSLNMAIDVLKEWGVDGKDFIPVVEPDAGHKQISSAKQSHQVGQGEAVSEALEYLLDAKSKGQDAVLISIYDPNNTADLTTIMEAKEKGITTLNLALGLVDTFDGYESAADKIHREAVTEAYEEQKAAKEAEEKAAEAATKPPRKTAAKKAATPRKRAAAKVVEPEDEPLPLEPEKPLSGTDKLVAAAVAREAAKKMTQEEKTARDAELTTVEISGTIVAGSSALPANLEPARPVAPVVDVWQDVAAAAPAVPGDTIVVAKADLIKINKGIKAMAAGMAMVVDGYNAMLGGE